MRNKTQTRSNADTEDGDEDDFDFTATGQHSQSHICDVWAHNFDQELQRIATLVDEYPIISLVLNPSSRILSSPGILSTDSAFLRHTRLRISIISSFGITSKKLNSFRLGSPLPTPRTFFPSPPPGNFILPST